jgi:hypothetical protein
MSGTDTIYQQLRGHLHTLGMSATADQLAPALQAAQRDKPAYSEFLAERYWGSWVVGWRLRTLSQGG